jgi:ketosteroid isomerase-like protein
MTSEGNTTIVLGSYDALNRQDLDTALAAYAPDAVNHGAPGAPPGREGLRRVLIVACSYSTAPASALSLLRTRRDRRLSRGAKE